MCGLWKTILISARSGGAKVQRRHTHNETDDTRASSSSVGRSDRN